MVARGRRFFVRDGPRSTGAEVLASARARAHERTAWQSRSATAVHVEDPADRYFHRFLAAGIVALLLPSRISANQVTFARLGIGWAASFFLYWGFFQGGLGPAALWLAAAGALFVAMVLDCVDGHLARARGEMTELGRVLDGTADSFVILPLYVVIALGSLQLFGVYGFALAGFAGFSMWAHSIVHDKVKRLYRDLDAPGDPDMLADPGRAAASAGSAQAVAREASQEASRSARALAAIYRGYLRVQGALVPEPARRPEDMTAPPHGEAPKSRYRGTMRLNGLLGLGSHTLVLYVALACMAFSMVSLLVAHVLFATFFNAVMVVVMVQARRMGRTANGAAA